MLQGDFILMGIKDINNTARKINDILDKEEVAQRWKTLPAILGQTVPSMKAHIDQTVQQGLPSPLDANQGVYPNKILAVDKREEAR